MKAISVEEIIEILKTIEPNIGYDKCKYYRASVTLTDGLLLPCVAFKKSSEIVNLAIRRFEEEKKGKGLFSGTKDKAYKEIVKTFVATGNKINNYDISKVEVSKYAIPVKLLSLIKSETTMGWTSFVLKMKDGNCYNYGSSFLFDFFELPEGYTFNDVSEVINHSIALQNNIIVPFRESNNISKEEKSNIRTYRERPYFECYIDGI